jgi:catechol 2,3-dioxygenase-like lactoylglutathione lyase family enzyme
MLPRGGTDLFSPKTSHREEKFATSTQGIDALMLAPDENEFWEENRFMSAKGASRTSRNTSNMFKTAKAFPSFSVNDLRKAKEFYGQTLGLNVTELPEGLDVKLGNNLNVFLYPKPNHTPASFTVLNFPVDDIDDAVDELMNLGVRLEKYDLADIRTDEKGIMRGPGPQVAWFKDPAGNVLSVIQER